MKEEILKEWQNEILKDLSKLEKGYGKKKIGIERTTGIPIDILTVLLKRLRKDGKVEIIHFFNEDTNLCDGSGYALKGWGEL